MKLTGFYPVIGTSQIEASRHFYVDLMGFDVVFADDWYVSLRHDSYELALVTYDHPTVPEGYRNPAQECCSTSKSKTSTRNGNGSSSKVDSRQN